MVPISDYREATVVHYISSQNFYSALRVDANYSSDSPDWYPSVSSCKRDDAANISSTVLQAWGCAADRSFHPIRNW